MDCGTGHVRIRGHVHARTGIYVALCLRLVVAITNYERRNDPGGERLSDGLCDTLRSFPFDESVME